MANRIGDGGVAGQQKRLATAAAEIDLAPIAAAAWIGHPIDSAKSLKHGRLEPDLF